MSAAWTDPQPGLPARYPDQRSKCDGPISVGDRIVHLRGRYVHCRCAPGADDE